MTCELAHWDGAYVLGALSPTERLEFEEHLTRCDDCSRSVRELAGVPGLLAQVGPDDLLPVPPSRARSCRGSSPTCGTSSDGAPSSW